MVRIDEWPEAFQQDYFERPMPAFEARPFVSGPPVSERRLSLISTAGLHRRGDRPFTEQSGDFRIIPRNIAADDLVMSHISTNFDRIGFIQDADVAFPLNRVKELAAAGDLGSVADFHFSFMGATPPEKMEPSVREIVATIKADKVDAVLLCPV
ncbi:MAG: glycine/sarcosine/betaine reductase selenoprotein B family protein [Rhodospirillales bacterium]|nr:glycine/sarcosine/betaine reductase selenoprotein B family protein [Rhodospirillales bacterium]